jgi:hypothetical protein
MAESKYGKYLVTELKAPQLTPEAAAKYSEFARRILRIDETITPGSFQMSCSWYLHPNPGNSPEPHRHDCDEIIGFIGNNPEDPSDLGGEVEFWMEDEMHIITKSCLIFVPKGMKHCPLVVRRADRPIFHFSTVTAGQYTQMKDE